ncbi:NYN domain-containing protein [Nonomuraea phyllanthi]|uniref:NYN domain-containing protein n=1 Tax=Nonomuraea phyllanthi TaxID=2219224 RepID=A0A5C4W789_9ACTN|nr:NYN domain-containing protein [Nonomuraea phyllanthi]KAB8192291.1 NYN domain-containing protein [Nonomuraea phyllanthi]
MSTVVMGKYQEQTVRCRACGDTRRTYAEKQPDVALGTSMVADVATGKVDVAMLVSADSDLCAAIHTIRELDQERGTKTRVITARPLSIAGARGFHWLWPRIWQIMPV